MILFLISGRDGMSKDVAGFEHENSKRKCIIALTSGLMKTNAEEDMADAKGQQSVPSTLAQDVKPTPQVSGSPTLGSHWFIPQI